MEKGHKFGLMVENMKENIMKIRDRVLGLWNGVMENDMRDIG
jgi:hypothetical protein